MAKDKKTTKLKAPAGTDEANFGTERFRVDNDGTIEVPDEAVGPLLELGGFVEVLPPPVIPDGHALVKHSDPDASCGGERFGDGFLVPVHMVEALKSHGFKSVEHVTETVDQAEEHVKTDEKTAEEPAE